MRSVLPFNPFDKHLNEIVVEDLAILRNVSEGWYVEYKKQEVPARNIAKSISAFANHYGGWLFYGVDESSEGTHTAGSFPGIGRNQASSFVDRIRDAARNSVNPSPYYEFKIVYGPCPQISLPNERAIIIVLVPSGPNAPYVHSDGRIYRRIADSSDPKAETDRFILDQLWERGQKSQERLSSFLKGELALSKGEEETSHLELFLLPDPLGTTGQSTSLTFDEFIKHMTNTAIPGFSVLFDNFYTMADGFIGRQVGSNDPYNLVLTWRHYSNGSSVIDLPFRYLSVGGISSGGWLHGYKYESAFLGLLSSKGHNAGYLLDVTQLPLMITAVINQQRHLMELGGLVGPLYAKAAIHNIWRRIPYMDTQAFIRLVSDRNLPVIQFEDEFAPGGTTFDSLVLLPEFQPESEKNESEKEMALRQFQDATYILWYVLNALGLPKKVILEDPEGEWYDAALRAESVSEYRKALSDGSR